VQTVDADPQIFLDLCTGSGFITFPWQEFYFLMTVKRH